MRNCLGASSGTADHPVCRGLQPLGGNITVQLSFHGSWPLDSGLPFPEADSGLVHPHAAFQQECDEFRTLPGEPCQHLKWEE